MDDSLPLGVLVGEARVEHGCVDVFASADAAADVLLQVEAGEWPIFELSLDHGDCAVRRSALRPRTLAGTMTIDPTLPWTSGRVVGCGGSAPLDPSGAFSLQTASPPGCAVSAILSLAGGAGVRGAPVREAELAIGPARFAVAAVSPPHPDEDVGVACTFERVSAGARVVATPFRRLGSGSDSVGTSCGTLADGDLLRSVDGEELAALDDASFVGAILALVDSVASDAPLAYEVDR